MKFLRDSILPHTFNSIVYMCTFHIWWIHQESQYASRSYIIYINLIVHYYLKEIWRRRKTFYLHIPICFKRQLEINYLHQFINWILKLRHHYTITSPLSIIPSANAEQLMLKNASRMEGMNKWILLLALTSSGWMMDDVRMIVGWNWPEVKEQDIRPLHQWAIHADDDDKEELYTTS